MRYALPEQVFVMPKNFAGIKPAAMSASEMLRPRPYFQACVAVLSIVESW